MANGTVTYVDGNVIGINTDGSKETEGPHKDKLKTTYTVLIKKDTTRIEVGGESLHKKVADILPGDQITTSGPDNEVTSIKISRPEAVQQKLDAKGFGPVDPTADRPLPPNRFENPDPEKSDDNPRSHGHSQPAHTIVPLPAPTPRGHSPQHGRGSEGNNG